MPAELLNLPQLVYLSISYNMLYSTNPEVTAFLDRLAPGWDQTQTLPPTDLGGEDVGEGTVVLEWQPIEFSEGAGYYEIYTTTQTSSLSTAAPQADNLIGTTDSKSTSTYTVNNLLAGSTYYFIVRTFTPAFDDQPNDLWSEFTQPVAVTTSGAEPLRITFLPLVVRATP